MYTDYIEFDTPYGPAYVVYNAPEAWELRDEYTATKGVRVCQVAVRCPNNIVWDSNGKWWPEPQVVDYVLPRARAVAALLGVPAYEWLRKFRRSDVWAIEREFQLGEPISVMMDFYHEDDYDGVHSFYKERGVSF